MDVSKKIVLTLSLDDCNTLRKGLTKLTIEEGMNTLIEMDTQVKKQLEPADKEV